MVVNCNYDCFNCPYSDCINDALPTSKEAEFMQIGHMKYTGAKNSEAGKRYRASLKGKLTHQKAQKNTTGSVAKRYCRPESCIIKNTRKKNCKGAKSITRSIRKKN
jgi:hypothetical protein